MMRSAKSILLTVFLFFFTVNIFAQGEKKIIETTFKTYMQTIRNNEFAKAATYIPEEFFTYFKKEQIIKLMEQTMNSPEYDIKIGDLGAVQIDGIQKINQKYYAMVEYESNIAMKFKPKDKNETSSQLKSRNNLAKLALQNSFGTDHVRFDENTNWFHTKTKKNACAISKNGKTDWKFIVIEPKQRLILDRILPKEITSKI